MEPEHAKYPVNLANPLAAANALRDYHEVREQMAALYPEMDDGDLLDTIDGEADLAQIIIAHERKRQQLLDLLEAIKRRRAELSARASRIENATERLKGIIARVMKAAGRKSIVDTDFTISLRKAPGPLMIVSPGDLPEEFREIVEEVKVDRRAIRQALSEGRTVPGAVLGEGGETISVMRG